MRRCWCVPVYDGYGTTEAGGIATDNVISPDVDVKLVDVPELGYFTTGDELRFAAKQEEAIDSTFHRQAATWRDLRQDAAHD